MIEIKGLYKAYDKTLLYEDFNMTIAKGKITTILGASGCGKTTLLRMLAGLESYHKGSIKGINQRQLSMIFQEDRLIPWLNVRDNIKFVLNHNQDNKKDQDMHISTTLKGLQMQQYEEAPIQALSGGMQRRVSLARALAYNYDYLLMDEAFKGIDRGLKLEIIHALKKEWQEKKKTVILITHDAEEAQLLSDYIYEFYGKPVGYHTIKC